MLRKILEHVAVGFSVSTAIAILVQILLGQAGGNPVVTPAFAARFASEGVAAVAQIGLIGLIGATFSAAALVLQIERWSYLRQGAVHLLLTAAVWVPVSLLCWSPVEGWGLWVQIGSWTFTYAVIWLIQYLVCRRRVAEANARIEARRRGEDVRD